MSLLRTCLLACSTALSIGVAPFAARAQDSTYAITPRLLLDLPLIDAPYVWHAAVMAANKRLGITDGTSATPAAADLLRGYESPSMQQALAVTKDLHAMDHYLTNKLWNGWLAPTSRKRRLLNRVAANVQAGIVDYVLAYQLMVFGPAWMHEEFHRSGTTLRGIPTFNETYYRFGGGIPSASVSHVSDADMARFKQEDPAGLVRSFAAGIEAQYALLRAMQQDDLFERTHAPNVAMNILLTKQAVGYVPQFRAADYDRSIDTMNLHGAEVAERDYVGWDFTAWVYDLHRPDEPYAARGGHPYGEGVDRAIKRARLTPEEDAYLVRMGDLQYLNFLAPDMIGVHGFRIGARTRFNFAVRHILTSFGYDLGGDLLLDHRGRHWLLGIHTYHNHARSFGGIELMRKGLRVHRAEVDLRGMLWVQPAHGGFHDSAGRIGGLATARAGFPLGRALKAYAEAEGKTDGWVMANPYLKSNLSIRGGLALDIR
ncbi:MAG: hypothetical protein JST66_13925 [Bacteroidetes bacterium]|nr:hypothetical protein [Bacteroidota bacterium]